MSRRTTWHSPDGRTHNQIGCIFVRRRHSTGVNRARTRTFNKPDIGRDHDLVMMTLQLKANKENKPTRACFDLEKLKDPEVAQRLQEERVGKFAPLLLLDQEPQELCDKFIHIVSRGNSRRKIRKREKDQETVDNTWGLEQLWQKKREKKKKEARWSRADRVQNCKWGIQESTDWSEEPMDKRSVRRHWAKLESSQL